MTGKIFRSIFIVTGSVLLLCVIIVFAVTFNYYTGELKDALSKQAQYVAAGVESGGMEYLSDIGEKTDVRITWVASDGSVLYDSKADAASMENHRDREEIREALESENGVGIATRYSGTMSEKTTYYALRVKDGSVIRVSEKQYSAWVIVMSTVQPILVVLVAAIILAGVLASRLSKSIVRPINEIDLDHPENAQVYEEMAPIIRRLTAQNRSIKKQMEELKVKQTEFNAITENMSEGMIIIDAATEILSSNQCALSMFGVEGKPPKSILLLDGRDTFREAVRLALSGENGYDSFRRGGRCYNILATPVKENGEVVGAVLVILDETEKEERETLRREFTSNVSHELKTPLTSISGFAELIRSGMTDAEDTRHFADNIYKEARRLIVLVGDIIKLSQLDGGEIPYDECPQDLYEIAKETEERLDMVAASHKVNLELTGEHTSIRGNRQILEEMIYNLVDNGIKYNHEGGNVRIRVAEENGRAVVSVADDGIGIPKDQQSRVFERFYRVDKSHSKEIGGTGLGLSIVKHGAAFHKATVTMNSDPGKGTEIFLTFPPAEE